MKRIFISFAVSSAMLFSHYSLSALLGLNDSELESLHGQINLADVTPRVTRSDSKSMSLSEHSNLQPRVSPLDLIGLDSSDLQLSQGIELDLEIQTSFDFEYIDPDGAGEEGAEGSLLLSGVHIGSSKTPLTTDKIQSDAPFLASELALINNILIDVDSKAGMFITIEQLGDKYGNGIDVIVNDVYLGGKDNSAGGILIEDISNFIQDSNVETNNQLFSMNLSTLDDGKQTANGNWVPFYSKVLPIEGAGKQGIDILSSDLLSDTGLPGLSANTIIDASFVLSIDKVAWVDDGNEFGLAGFMVYQGIDTDNDGIDDTVGPARLTQMKLETVDHKAFDGSDVEALYIENLDFKADIAIQSIYVGQPENSLGALHIKGLDTAGTSVWVYPH
jgi:hypothetical protein